MVIKTDPISAYKNKEEAKFYSISRLKTYKECGEYYRRKYVEKEPCFVQSNSTVCGTLTHAALEHFYKKYPILSEKEKKNINELLLDSFYEVAPSEFRNMGISDVGSILSELNEYYNSISNLYKRASKDYTGEDSIRTKSGGICKAPEMTSVWKKEVKSLNINFTKDIIDSTFKKSLTDYKEVSITEAYCKTINLLKQYRHPSEIINTMYCELELSEWNEEKKEIKNPVLFPFIRNYKDNTYINGYIDNISKIEVEGREENCVIDYKTSKEEFSKSTVSHNQQLLLYAYCVEKLTGEEVNYIGIMSLTHNKLVYVEVDRRIQKTVLTKLATLIELINAKLYLKNIPDSKYSKCLSSFGKECIFLSECWSKFTQIEEEPSLDIKEYFNV